MRNVNGQSKVVIIGGGLSGLVAANVLSYLGIESLVLEKSNKIGGWNTSFTDELGNTFDHGYHALDYNRSIITTKFFQKVMNDNYIKFKLKRGLVLKNYLFPYNLPLAEWPKELKEFFDSDPIVDNIRGDLKRNKIAEVYGVRFSNFIFDEVLHSYPSQRWAIKNGGKEEDFSATVYPWFFPKVRRENVRDSEWEIYHDKMRNSTQYILYPKQGGFAAFIDAILEDTNTKFCETRTGVKDIQFNINKENKNLVEIISGDESIEAGLFIWCSSPVLLLRLLKVENLDLGIQKPQKVVLGSFAFEKPINSEYHEILVGSLEHKINRISLPGRISQKTDNLIQVEFFFPEDEYPLDEEYWKDGWLKSLKKIGILKDNNDLKNFMFFTETRGFVSTERYDSLIDHYKEKFLDLKIKNMIIPYFNVGPENINRIIPETIINVVNSLKLINAVYM